ncbi:MAG: hypothetical protein ACRDSO_10765, partial [Pseudonocardiaceae bacterium]
MDVRWSVSTMNLRKMEGKSMRILNRVIAAGALVVPIGLGVSGVAVADVAADSSALPTQIGVSEDDGSGDCDDCGDGSDHCDDGDGDGGLLGLGIFESEDPTDNGQCEEDDDDGNPVLG